MALAALVPSVFGQSFDEDYAPARAAAVSALEEWAEWCGASRLGADREAAFEAILVLDPEHEDAHKALKHVRQRDGSWSIPDRKSSAKNANKPREEESRERRAAIAKALLDAGAPLVDKYGGAELAAKAALRARVVADALAIDSEHEGARRLGGEAWRSEGGEKKGGQKAEKGDDKGDGEWVLIETVRSKERRGELKDLVQRLIAAVPAPETIEPTEAERALGVAWAHAVSTPRARVLTSGALEEARNVAVITSAAIELFGELFQREIELPAEYTIHLLASAPARDAFVQAWPGWTDTERAQLKTWAGCGVPGDIHQARWDADEAHRLDGAVRHTLGLLMLRELGFDHQKCAWAWEGVGIYLTRELVGTRYTWYSTGPTSGDAESKDLLGRLMSTDVNWVNEFYQRAKRGKAPPLEKLCAVRIDRFGVDDVLGSYSLAAYLIEGRPDELPAVLSAAAPDGGAAALARLFDGDLDNGDKRLLRWLSERK